MTNHLSDDKPSEDTQKSTKQNGPGGNGGGGNPGGDDGGGNGGAGTPGNGGNSGSSGLDVDGQGMIDAFKKAFATAAEKNKAEVILKKHENGSIKETKFNLQSNVINACNFTTRIFNNKDGVQKQEHSISIELDDKTKKQVSLNIHHPIIESKPNKIEFKIDKTSNKDNDHLSFSADESPPKTNNNITVIYPDEKLVYRTNNMADQRPTNAVCSVDISVDKYFHGKVDCTNLQTTDGKLADLTATFECLVSTNRLND